MISFKNFQRRTNDAIFFFCVLVVTLVLMGFSLVASPLRSISILVPSQFPVSLPPSETDSPLTLPPVLFFFFLSIDQVDFAILFRSVLCTPPPQILVASFPPEATEFTLVYRTACPGSRFLPLRASALAPISVFIPIVSFTPFPSAVRLQHPAIAAARVSPFLRSPAARALARSLAV